MRLAITRPRPEEDMNLSQCVHILKDFKIVDKVNISHKTKSSIMKIVVLQSLYVTHEQCGRLVAWHKRDFSFYREISEITSVSINSKVVVESPQNGITNTLFVFQMDLESKILKICQYPELVSRPSEFAEHFLTFHRMVPELFEISLQCKNSIVIEYKISQWDYVVDVYMQDTLQQAWEPIHAFIDGLTRPILIQDRFVFLRENHTTCYDKGMSLHHSTGEMHRYNRESLAVGKKVVSLGLVGLYQSAEHLQSRLWSFDPGSDICQEVEPFNRLESEIPSVCHYEKKIAKLSSNLVALVALRGYV